MKKIQLLLIVISGILLLAAAKSALFNVDNEFKVETELLFYDATYRYMADDSILNIEDQLELAREVESIYLTCVLPYIDADEHTKNFLTGEQFSNGFSPIQTVLMLSRNGVPPSLALAQVILESSNTKTGKRVDTELARKYKNLHGIKYNTVKSLFKDKDFKSTPSLPTREYLNGKWYNNYKDKFVKLDSEWESFYIHNKYLTTSSYYKHRKGDSLKDWLEVINKYATSPNYQTLLKILIKRYRLDLLDKYYSLLKDIPHEK